MITQVRMCVYLHNTQSINAFTEFLSRINIFCVNNNLNVVFIAEYLVQYSGTLCSNDIKGCDVLVCIGPDKGGFMGSPIPIVGFNTNPPYGFTDIGVSCAVHELMHYLGMQDLYWLKGNGIPIIPEITNDIMYNPYTTNPILTSISIKTINFNGSRLGSGSNILYPKQRSVTSISIKTMFPNAYYKLYTRTRDWTTFSSVISSVPAVTGYTDSLGSFITNVIAGDSVDNNFDVYKITINGINIWFSSLIAYALFLFRPGMTKCYIIAEESVNWCKPLFDYSVISYPSDSIIEVS